MKSTVVALRDEGFDIRTVDVRFNPKLAMKYRVRRVPTFVYVVNDEEVRRRTGSLSKSALRNMFRPSWF